MDLRCSQGSSVHSVGGGDTAATLILTGTISWNLLPIVFSLIFSLFFFFIGYSLILQQPLYRCLRSVVLNLTEIELNRVDIRVGLSGPLVFMDGSPQAVRLLRNLNSQPQTSSANVDLTTETVVVWPVSEAKVVSNWQKNLGVELAKHLTSCEFESNIRGYPTNFIVDHIHCS